MDQDFDGPDDSTVEPTSCIGPRRCQFCQSSTMDSCPDDDESCIECTSGCGSLNCGDCGSLLDRREVTFPFLGQSYRKYCPNCEEMFAEDQRADAADWLLDEGGQPLVSRKGKTLRDRARRLVGLEFSTQTNGHRTWVTVTKVTLDPRSEDLMGRLSVVVDQAYTRNWTGTLMEIGVQFFAGGYGWQYTLDTLICERLHPKGTRKHSLALPFESVSGPVDDDSLEPSVRPRKNKRRSKSRPPTHRVGQCRKDLLASDDDLNIGDLSVDERARIAWHSHSWRNASIKRAHCPKGSRASMLIASQAERRSLRQAATHEEDALFAETSGFDQDQAELLLRIRYGTAEDVFLAPMLRRCERALSRTPEDTWTNLRGLEQLQSIRERAIILPAAIVKTADHLDIGDYLGLRAWQTRQNARLNALVSAQTNAYLSL